MDRIMEVHRQTNDRDGLAKYFDACERLCKNIHAHLEISKGRHDAPVYERVISASSLIMIASGVEDSMQRSQTLMRRYMWTKPDTIQAQICSEYMLSLPEGPSSSKEATQSPVTKALMNAMLGKTGTDSPGMTALANELLSGGY